MIGRTFLALEIPAHGEYPAAALLALVLALLVYWDVNRRRNGSG